MTSKAGKLQLLVNGYRFGISNKNKKDTHWRCVKFGALGCRAWIKTYPNQYEAKDVFAANQDHNHGRYTR